MSNVTLPAKMPDNVRNLINEIWKTNLDALSVERLKELYKLLAYQGPDVFLLLTEWNKRLEAMFVEYNKADAVLIPGFKKADKKDFKSSVTQVVVALFVLRGGNLDVLLEKLDASSDQYKVLQYLKTTAGLLPKLSKSQKGSKNLTCARIALCFPHYTCAFVKWFSDASPPITGIVDTLPVEFHTSVAPSLWSVELFNTHQAAHLKFMVMFAKIVNEKDPSKAPTEDALKKIQLASFKSKAFGTDFRTSSVNSLSGFNAITMD